MITTTITVYHKGCEFEVDVEGHVTSGGSDNYGSDEPAWIDVDDITYTSTVTDKPLSKRLTKWLEENCDDYAGDMLVEAAENM